MVVRKGWLPDQLRSFEGPLLRYANRLVGDVESARDVVQDTFLRLCRQPPEQLEQLNGYLRQWLFTVCRNRAFDVLRKEGRVETLNDDIEVPAPDSPVRSLEQAEQSDKLLASVAALPPRQREMVHLKFSEGLSYKEIANITGASVSNVGFILHTAIKSLRQRMAAYQGSEA
ncbi:MAG: RNA polymerase sigma factor [Planctomycetota bacterium]|jgi:RNA polymerase sigma-70 factor (ECF subfamily)